MKLQFLRVHARTYFPPLQRGIKGDFVFKSLPASLYKGRSKKTNNSFRYVRNFTFHPRLNRHQADGFA